MRKPAQQPPSAQILAGTPVRLIEPWGRCPVTAEGRVLRKCSTPEYVDVVFWPHGSWYAVPTKILQTLGN